MNRYQIISCYRSHQFFTLIVLNVTLFSAAYYALAKFELFGAKSPSSLFDALYFSVVTISTLGYGDISPDFGIAKLMVIVQVISGVFIIGFALNDHAKKSKNKEAIKNQENHILNLLRTAAFAVYRLNKQKGGLRRWSSYSINEMEEQLIEMRHEFTRRLLNTPKEKIDAREVNMEHEVYIGSKHHLGRIKSMDGYARECSPEVSFHWNIIVSYIEDVSKMSQPHDWALNIIGANIVDAMLNLARIHPEFKGKFDLKNLPPDIQSILDKRFPVASDGNDKIVGK